MFQIIFNEISAAEMSRLPRMLQLELMSEFNVLPEDLEDSEDVRFGSLARDGKKLFRFRASEYRIYFEQCEEGVVIHRVLHKNTLEDFLFRSKLPLMEEDKVAQVPGFWKLIEEGRRASRK